MGSSFHALAAMAANSSSSCALEAPLTPTADDLATDSIGTPPWSGVKKASGKATIAVRPFLMMSSKIFVGCLNRADQGECNANSDPNFPVHNSSITVRSGQTVSDLLTITPEL